MIPRYAPQQIAKIFSDASRLQRWLDVELLACEGWAEIGRIPVEALSTLQGATIEADRIAELEAEQGHDMAAFVAAVQETVGDAGRYFHLGLTSSDVVDTALATQLRDAAAVIDADVDSLIGALIEQAERHRLTVMMGRTHGVHAEPLTLGVKLANFVDEVRRSRARLASATAEIAVGQITGAVGTHASVPPEVEEHVCQGLKLATAPVATQVLARDRHASFISALALLGAVLERLATTIRLLQITEVDEVEEPFGQRQKGSSAMPHKRNPVLCERICGLARVLRGYASTAMEDVALWHERDISHSSAERVILPDACALSDYIVRLSTRIVEGLRVKSENMMENIELHGGIVFSQQVLTALIVEAEWPRERAYRAVQALAARARDDDGSFRDLVALDPDIAGALTEATIAHCFDIDPYLAHIDETYRRLGLSTTTARTATDASAPVLAIEAGLAGGRMS
ncbi:MAG TPA: adenylosuccinate lyase [Candidatus Saccharimonadales bacterium]|nr:adenylosuccinate lyase [Candidatus Saccharimonadales bacterium]